MALTKVNSGLVEQLASSNMPSGSVLQVVSVSSATEYSTTGNTFVAATNMNVSITPKFATSKILVTISGGSMYTTTSGHQMQTTIVRNNSINLGSSTRGFGQIYNAAGATQAHMAMEYLDSPNTTSSTNYSLYFKSASSGQAVMTNVDGSPQTITVMEIAQ